LAIAAFWLIMLLTLAAVKIYLEKRGNKASNYVFAFFVYVAGLLTAVVGGFGLAREGFELINLLAMAVFIASPVFLVVMQTIARRNSFKIIANCFCITALLVVAIGIDAFLIEPQWLEVTHVVLHSDKITKPVKIAVLSDLQTDHIGDYEAAAVKTVMDEKPDLILLPGDYIQCLTEEEQGKGHADLNKLLKDTNFSAPLGVYAVQGNVDVDLIWPTIFADLPITTMDQTTTIESGELSITGLSFDDSFNTHVSITPSRSGRYHIVFGHGPDFALSSPKADLLVAGHTHGGQVQLPLFGPPITLSKVPRHWAQGTKEMQPIETQTGTTLILSRGVGMERRFAPRLRFLCRPQLIFVQLEPINHN